jgi:GT2 family glycosyltransferase
MKTFTSYPVEISIAVNSYKNTELLRLCLESIERNVCDVSYEVIVVDGATEEPTALMMREDFPAVKFFSFAGNVGFPKLVNKGLELSRGRFVLFLNSDILVTKTSVEGLCRFLEKHRDVGMVGPKLLGFNEQFQESCFRFYRPETILFRRTFLGKIGIGKHHIDWFVMKDYDHECPITVDWLMGSAMMVSREAIEKVGLMDEHFFMYMEDVDWCRRFWEQGFGVAYDPRVRMYHYHGKGSARGGFVRSLLWNRLTWHHIESALKYFRKYRGKPLPVRNERIEEGERFFTE